MKHNAVNERMKRAYFRWMRESQGQGEATVDVAAAAIHRFEVYTGFRDFKAFHIEQTIAFKRNLREQVSQSTGKLLRVQHHVAERACR